MNNRVATNIAFIVLFIFLFISGMKSFIASGVFSPETISSLGDFSSVNKSQGLESFGKKTESTEPQIILRDFDEIKQTERSQTIDRGTASRYTKVRPLTGTEILELGKIYKIGQYLNTPKRLIIYVNKGSDKDVQAFISEFAKVRVNYSHDPYYVFIPLDTLWDLNDMSAQNSHDRVINNFKKDCGLVCIIDTEKKLMLRMKGYDVNKKSAQIMGVMINK